MKVFADASALVAIIAREKEALALADYLDAAEPRLYSAMSAWEAIAALCRGYRLPLDLARQRVSLFLDRLEFRLVPIAEQELALAIHAYGRFGKGHHPAALNMGDCFAYACAKANSAKLLFIGGDFSKTDIPAAMTS